MQNQTTNLPDLVNPMEQASNGIKQPAPLKPLVRHDALSSHSYSEYTPERTGDERGFTKTDEVCDAPPFKTS